MGIYFKETEFKCPCCGKVSLNENLIPTLDRIRGMYGKPMYITSGYRCPEHNTEVGGKPSSAHLTGEAADISCVSDRDRFNLIYAAITSGINRIGISSKFIHIDISESLPQNVLWLYGA